MPFGRPVVPVGAAALGAPRDLEVFRHVGEQQRDVITGTDAQPG
jgi:hypothetical protein